MVLIGARFFQFGVPLAEGLDPSWNWALNEAAAHGLIFGRDITFNFGPYAALATRLYDPALRGMIMGGASVLAIAFCAGVVALDSWVTAVALIVLAPLVNVMAALSFAFPLPALLLAGGLKAEQRAGLWALFAIAATLAGLGLLPLVKGSFLGVSLIAAPSIAVLLWLAGLRAAALLALPAVALCMGAAWCAAGQPISALPAYLFTTLDIVGGHNEAMAQAGAVWQLVLALAAMAAFLALLAFGMRRIQRLPHIVVGVAAAGLLFVAFKAGYVRQDGYHVADTVETFGLMFLLLAGRLAPREAAGAAAIGVFLMAGPLTPPGPDGPPSRVVVQRAARSVHEAWFTIARPDVLALRHLVNLQRMRNLPWHPDGTADFYESNQALLFASGLAWSPRPMFQSYSAYTPRLAAANAAHLVSPAAPDNVFFNLAPIDDRLPALADGASWPALLGRYDAVAYDGALDVAWLRRVGAAPPGPGAAVIDRDVSLGARVDLPADAGPLWARVDVAASVPGRIAGLMLRPPALYIDYVFAGGATRRVRFIPGMARTGFVLAPLISDTLDFLRLRQDGAGLPRPVAFAVSADAGAWAWRRDFHVTVSRLPLAPAGGTVRLENFARPMPVTQAPEAQGAACFVDRVNGGGALRRDWPVRLEGWSVFDTAGKVAPDAVSLGFRSADGTLLSIPAQKVPRADVNVAYELPEDSLAGFTATFDPHLLAPGDYTIMVLPERQGQARACKINLHLSTP